MSSWQAHYLSYKLRRTFKRALAAATDIAQGRSVLNSGPVITPRDVTITPAEVVGVPGEWLAPRGDSMGTLLYLHGGGYCACSPQSHRPITAYFARQGFRVFAPDYRLAPEHPYPAALDDVQAVYTALRAAHADGQPLVLAGDSAGGGLAIALMLRLREHGLQQVSAAALFSPFVDLALSGASLVSNSRRCAMFTDTLLRHAAQAYLGGTDAREPYASPLYADLHGLPPMLIHVGANETLRDDSVRLDERASAAGVEVHLQVWPAVPHDWQLFAKYIPEGRESLATATSFLKKWLTLGATAAPPTTLPQFDVAVIGSGFSGLGMAIKLKEAGVVSFVVLEKAAEIGGTWRENTYPGCACDVPSHLYSFSWEPNPEWSRTYAVQGEIQAYLKRCVAKYGVAPYFRFGIEVKDAAYDEARNCWQVRTADGRAITARVLVSAMGGLHRPAIPQLPGIERFKGAAFHSSQWRHDVDLAGKRIAVVGTGASAIQFVPQIAPLAAQLTLFQRTPPWILPRGDRPVSARRRWIFRHVPFSMRLFRYLMYWKMELRVIGFVHPRFMKAAEAFSRNYLLRRVPDPQLRATLTPTYAMGCKRILISSDFYPALARSNVAVVTAGIAAVSENSITGSDGIVHEVDVIIYGTGFQVTKPLCPIPIFGRGGVEIGAAWRAGPQTYLGVAAPGFPNLFFLLGPNTGLGHNSVVFMVEQQIRYVVRCLASMKAQSAVTMEARPQAQQRFSAGIQKATKDSVWASGCTSWYLDEHGNNVSLWPGFSVGYWYRLKRVALADFCMVAKDG